MAKGMELRVKGHKRYIICTPGDFGRRYKKGIGSTGEGVTGGKGDEEIKR